MYDKNVLIYSIFKTQKTTYTLKKSLWRSLLIFGVEREKIFNVCMQHTIHSTNLLPAQIYKC